MGFLARRLIKQNLNLIDVVLEDTSNSIFNVFGVPDVLTQGRSSFKINGSPFLKKEVPLKMEMLDSAGNTVYMAPVDLVGEEVEPFLTFRYITVEVYRRPINEPGLGLLTIVGELDPTQIDSTIPPEFQDTYNVRYSQRVNLDVATSLNTQPILFYKNPTIEAQETVKARIVNTEVTQSTRVFSSGSAQPRSDIDNKIFTVTTGSQEQDDGIVEVSKPNKDVEKFVNDYKYKTGLYGRMPPLLGRRGVRARFASRESPRFKIRIPGGGLSAKMQNGTITIPAHTKIINKVEEDGTVSNNEIDIPEFTSKVDEIINDTTLVPKDIPFFHDPVEMASFGKVTGSAVQVDDFDDVPISMSFEDVITTVVSSSVHFDSFLDLKIKNLRPFSGDVYRVRVIGKMQSQNVGFTTLADTAIESPEALIDTASPSGFLRTGYFIDQNHINNYWSASSFDSLTKSNNVAMLYTGSQYIDSVRISGSNRGKNESILIENKPGYTFTLDKGVRYDLSAKVSGKPTEKVQQDNSVVNKAQLYFHLSGSNLNPSEKISTNTYVGSELKNPDDGRTMVLEVDSDHSAGFKDLDRIEHTFEPTLNLDKLNNTDTILQIRADSGIWHISDLSIRPAMDTGFSPDEYSITLPLPRSQRPDKLDLIIEYFDVNNNAVETITTQKDIPISGSTLVIDGDDNLLTGSLFIGNTAGEGVEAAGKNSAYIRTVSYRGFQSASAHGQGGFMMWSGSVKPNDEDVDSYSGAGLEIHDGNSGVNESYFKFRTRDADNDTSSSLDIRTSRYFLGQEGNSFVSGALGNIEISSSNFHLSPDGDITASNFNLNSGTIQAGVTVLGTVAANQIEVPAVGDTLAEITTAGYARFVSASIGGFDVDSVSISDTSKTLVMSSSGQITGSDVLFTGGTIAGWTINGTTFQDAAAKLRLNAGNSKITINSHTFGNSGIQLDYNSGSPRFYVGDGSNDYIKYVHGTGVDIKTAVFVLDTSTLDVNTASGGTIKLGVSPPSDLESNGIILSGSGDFNFQQDANNYIRQSAGSFKIAADNFDLATTTISMSNASGGKIALGASTAPANLSSDGIFFSGSGDFNLQGNSTNYIRRTGTALDIKAGTFDLDATTLILDSGTNSGVIKLGPSGGPGSATGTSNGGVYVDGTGKFNLVGDADNYIRFNATGLEIATDNLTVESSGNVIMTGQVTANAGAIGGWSIANNFISGSNLIIHAGGRIETANYVSNLKGFRLEAAGNGFLEVENARIRGTLKTTVFEKETVNAVGGQLYVANSTTITGSAGLAIGETTMSVANSTGFTGSYNSVGGEIIAVKKVHATGFQTEYMYIQSASRVDPDSEVDLRGFLHVIRGYNQGFLGDSGSLGDFANTSSSYEEGQVIVSTGATGSGFIRLNANPNDTTTPYIDIVERTGSGVYDIELKARLGDLSGLSSGLVHGEISPGFGLYSENVFLTGGIVANTGSIAGVQMRDDQLYIGNGNHNNINTPFYVSGKNDATAGDFSLSNKLVWDASAEALTVVGSITVVSGQVFDQMAALGTSTASLQNQADSLGSATASLQSQANSLGNATASLQNQANALGEATASLSQGSASMAAIATLTGTGLAIKDASSNLLANLSSNIHIQGVGGTIYMGVTGSSGDWVEIDSSGIDIMRNNYSVGNWTDSTFRVGLSGSEHIEIDGGGMRVNDGTTMLSKFGSDIHLNRGTIYVGITGSEHVKITTDGIEIKDSTTGLAKFSGAGAIIGITSQPHISASTSIFTVQSADTNDRIEIGNNLVDSYVGGYRKVRLSDGVLSLGAPAGASVTHTSTDSVVRVNGGGVLIYKDSNNYASMSSAGMDIYQGGSQKASFGSNVTLTGGEITVQGTTGADGHEKLKIWSGNIGIYTNNARRIAIDDDGIAIGRSGSADTTTSTTAHQVTINNNGIYSYHNAQNYSHVGPNGLKIYQASNEKASFGADVVLTGGNITVRSSTGEVGDDRLVIGSNSVSIYNANNRRVHIADGSMNLGVSASAGQAVADNIRIEPGNGIWVYGCGTDDYVRVHTDKVEISTAGTTVAEFGATTLIGDDTTEHVEITNSHLKLSDGGTDYVTIDSSGVQIGAAATGITLTTAGAATFNGTVKIGGSSGTTLTNDNTLNADFPQDRYLVMHIPCMHKPGTTSTGDGNGADVLPYFGQSYDADMLSTPGGGSTRAANAQGLAVATGIDGRPDGSIRVQGASGNTKFLVIADDNDVFPDQRVFYNGEAIGLSFWIRLHDLNSGGRAPFVGGWDSHNDHYGYHNYGEVIITGGNFTVSGESREATGGVGNGDVWTANLGSYTHNASDWHHIVITQGTDNALHIYRNGVAGTWTDVLTNEWDVDLFGSGYVGTSAGAISSTNNGTSDIAEIRYYSKELSQEEVTALYQNPFGVSPKGDTEGNVGGWTIANDAIHSGTKVSNATFAAAGAITIGSSGYIGANQFYIDTSGNAFFKGTVDIANATIGSSAGTTSVDDTRQPFSDFFEVDGGDLRAKLAAKFGGNSFGDLAEDVNDNAGTCFIAGTQVLLTDGISKNIEDVVVGDLIVGHSQTNKVVKLDLTLLGNRKLYSFNGGPYFVTSDHPMLTTEGWKSIEPEETRKRDGEELYNELVGELKEGDILITTDAEVELKSITSKGGYDKDLLLYNFFLDGDHSYGADGYFAHNKLLEFTQGHNHFVSSSISLEPGDAVKLNSDNFLEKTDSAKSTDCIGIVWTSVNTMISGTIANGLKIGEGEQEAYINNKISSSVYVDSHGTVNTGSNYTLMKVASIGDSREFDANYDSGSNNVSVITGSMMGFKICNQGGLVSKGDLLCTSDTAGYLMKQPSEYVITSFSASVPQYEERQNINSFTVGKVMESCSFDSNGKTERVYGYLYCG